MQHFTRVIICFWETANEPHIISARDKSPEDTLFFRTPGVVAEKTTACPRKAENIIGNMKIKKTLLFLHLTQISDLPWGDYYSEVQFYDFWWAASSSADRGRAASWTNETKRLNSSCQPSDLIYAVWQSVQLGVKIKYTSERLILVNISNAASYKWTAEPSEMTTQLSVKSRCWAELTAWKYCPYCTR